VADGKAAARLDPMAEGMTEIQKLPLATVKFILRKNILCGDALTMQQADGSPIIFAEWNLVTGNQIKRRDYALDELLSGHEEQMNIFQIGWEYDEEVQAFIPAPVREYPLTDYRRLAQYE